jgi:hypothetical protein
MGEGEEHGRLELLFECIGNDEKESRGNGKGKSRFPAGMTDRKTTAKARQKQIPCGNDRQKDNGKSKGKSRFPAGMTDRKANTTADKAKAGRIGIKVPDFDLVNRVYMENEIFL